MSNSKYKIGDRVVRSVGDYVVGRVGEILNVEYRLNNYRYQVKWDGENKTWVVETSLELESIPYEIIPMTYHEKDIGFGRSAKLKDTRKDWPKYKRL